MSPTGSAGPQWSLELDAERIAWLTFDVPGASANALSRSAMEELNQRLLEIERAAPAGLVILSGKSGFIAGADLREFAQVSSPEEAVPFIRDAHAVFDRLERLPCPTVAAINGYCLGGGLELALACDWRIVSDDPKSKLGLPEIQLGLIPGAGGTQRLPRLIGIQTSLDMILTGKRAAVSTDVIPPLESIIKSLPVNPRDVSRSSSLDRYFRVRGFT